ncbi:DUF7620 family protein [Nocardia fluminea]|uniref:Uncharacterized protein n=1 Tax=Nocardia fluminea TaxID=134984 RepID=A0A2N3VH40_9NOCA|nr:hypothetical protein [Nocardia fluminea]PKV80923.1 hypothetical protein ATK86_5360 [Nocardia fluminea]
MWFRERSKESASTQQARVGAERAEAELVEVQKRRWVVTALASAIDGYIDRNHFGESIEAAMTSRRKAGM